MAQQLHSRKSATLPSAETLVVKMKSTLKILFIILVAYGCKASHDPVEDKLYECLIQEYKSNGIDIVPLLDSLENHYINKGILKDKSGQAKLEFYMAIAENGVVPKMAANEIADSVSKIKFFQEQIENCIKSSEIDSLTFEDSKYYKLMEEFKSTSEVNPKNAALCHTKILTSNDFEHPYYRAHMLLTFTRIYERESAFVRKIPLTRP